ncbi:TolC family protein [Spirosoma endophyticum]|uniref:Outer membrane protein, cobalt-zinc-cadmium efflux system n=1 Tax=Spirosoma endophyticum TaxID=662367 RepID=A0A1I1SER6_9BACT|nr:TolC family protein [Spirosoma endophyticum]SFD44985.1 outer membrane protein, cobalt-zinc-cadmium efflux system [Spirosoma endophyticum]
MRLLIFFVFISLFFARPTQAQDSLQITLRQADSLFVKNNLLLLAERFRIDASQAQMLQASLYDNPIVTLELSTYNGQAKRVLDVGGQGQKIVSIQQLLYTAGKRNKRIALASEAAQLTQFELLDLLRELRFDVRTRFYSIHFQHQTLARFNQQLATLQTTVAAYEVQYSRNNVSLRELLRLKALLFQLNNDRTAILFQLADDQRALRTLLSVDQPVKPLVAGETLARYRLPTQPEDTLRQMALRNRPDLKASESLAKQAELNYNLQRSLAVPDVRVGGTYDQNGSYIQNYVGLSVSTDIPVFNRNQGAIRAARSQINYQNQLQRQKVVQVNNEVSTSLQKVREVEQRVQGVEQQFTEQFDQLNRGVVTSFQKGNISLLEFVDLIEAYNDSISQLNRLKADRVSAYEELNYLIGDDLFK